MRPPPRPHLGRPGLLERLCDDDDERRPPDPSAALARALRVALLTRRGESAAAPELGTPGFAELVHGDQRAMIALQGSLRASLARLIGGVDPSPLEIVIERGQPSASLRIAVALTGGERPGAAEATIDARGLVRVAAGGRR